MPTRAEWNRIVNGESLTVDINSEYIQQLYRERDQALARNRQLEQANEAAETMVSSLTSLVRDWQTLLQEQDELPLYGPTTEFRLWEESHKLLIQRTKDLLGETRQ